MKKFFVVSVLLGAIFFLHLSNVFAGNDISSSLEYLQKFQDEDGGLTEDPASGAQSLESSWGAIAFASSGFNPATVSKDGSVNNLLSYSLNNICANTNITDIERATLVASASGIDARNVNGCNLVEKIENSEAPDGKIGSDIISTIFGALALYSVNVPVDQNVIDYILDAQQPDGGWNSGWGTEANITAQAVQSLALSGTSSGDPHIISAKNYLKSLQAMQGGIKYDSMFWTTSSDAFSDAYALQAIYALGESPDDVYWKSDNKTILDDLASLRQDNGSYNFSSDYGKLNPVWSSSIVLIAINQKHLGFRGDNLASYKSEDSVSSTPTPAPRLTPSPALAVSSTVSPLVQTPVKKMVFSVSAPVETPSSVLPPESANVPDITPTPIAVGSIMPVAVKGAENQSSKWETYLYYLIAIVLGLLVSIVINKYLLKNDKN